MEVKRFASRMPHLSAMKLPEDGAPTVFAGGGDSSLLLFG
jgi:hypothetical protein